MTQQVSQRGLDLIAQFEGLKLTAYFCPAGVPTIGYGHTKTVSADDVHRHKTITKAEAYRLLRMDAQDAVNAVNRLGAKLNQCQFDALVSLVFNCGPAPLKGGVGTAVRSGKCDLVPSQFMKWVKVKGQTSKGLVRRRNAECAMWRAVDPAAAFPLAAMSVPTKPEIEEDESVQVEVDPPKETPITHSHTMQGAAVAGIGAVSVAAETIQPVIDQVSNAKTTFQALQDLGSSGLVIGLVIIALGIGYVMYRRYRDRHFL